jgi:hypothetical protein
VGAGISGASVFTLTSWVTLSTLWGAAMLTDRWIDQPNETSEPNAPAGTAVSSAHPALDAPASYARP